MPVQVATGQHTAGSVAHGYPVAQGGGFTERGLPGVGHGVITCQNGQRGKVVPAPAKWDSGGVD